MFGLCFGHDEGVGGVVIVVDDHVGDRVGLVYASRFWQQCVVQVDVLVRISLGYDVIWFMGFQI